MKKTKAFLSIFIVCAMSVTFIPATGFASEIQQNKIKQIDLVVTPPKAGQRTDTREERWRVEYHDYRIQFNQQGTLLDTFIITRDNVDVNSLGLKYQWEIYEGEIGEEEVWRPIYGANGDTFTAYVMGKYRCVITGPHGEVDYDFFYVQNPYNEEGWYVRNNYELSGTRPVYNGTPIRLEVTVNISDEARGAGLSENDFRYVWFYREMGEVPWQIIPGDEKNCYVNTPGEYSCKVLHNNQEDWEISYFLVLENDDTDDTDLWGYIWESQTNRPQISTTTPHVGDVEGWWVINSEGDPYIGEFEAGKTYYLYITFPDMIEIWDDTIITINGKQMGSFGDYRTMNELYYKIPITAVSDTVAEENGNKGEIGEVTKTNSAHNNNALGKIRIIKKSTKKVGKKTGMDIRLSKCKSKPTYVQLQLSHDKAFKKTIKTHTSTYKKVKKMKHRLRLKIKLSKKKYYLRARVVKRVGGKNYYGTWSKPVTIIGR